MNSALCSLVTCWDMPLIFLASCRHSAHYHLTSVHRGCHSLIFMSFLRDKCDYSHFTVKRWRQRKDSLLVLAIELQISDVETRLFRENLRRYLEWFGIKYFRVSLWRIIKAPDQFVLFWPCFPLMRQIVIHWVVIVLSPLKNKNVYPLVSL